MGSKSDVVSGAGNTVPSKMLGLPTEKVESSSSS